MGYQLTRETPGCRPPIIPKALTSKRRSLLRCEYCGMSFDGEECDNCPHCNAPRPNAGKPDSEESYERCVKAVYIEGFAYEPKDAQRIIAAANEESETTFSSDNTMFTRLSTKKPDFRRIADRLGIVPLENVDCHMEIEGNLVSGTEAHKLLKPCSDIADECVRVRKMRESLTRCGCGYVRLTSGKDVGPERSITWHEESITRIRCDEPMVWFRTWLDDGNHMHTVAIEEGYTLNTNGLILFSKTTYRDIATRMADEFDVDVWPEPELFTNRGDGYMGTETRRTLMARLPRKH